MTHRKAVALMILATFLWSIAGVVTRHLDSAHSFEVTFWRSLFNALALITILTLIRGKAFWRNFAQARWPIWISGICWSIMFTAFMVGLTLTSVGNVLVAMAAGPLITALFARLFLGHRLPSRTWYAIAIASTGIAWMFGREAMAGISPLGTSVALLVPLAAAINWTVLQFVSQRNTGLEQKTHFDMLPAVLIGAILSALSTFPLALPLRTTTHDLYFLGFLGVVQLALPCLLVVRVARKLPAAEIALLGLLEVIFGVSWAWMGAGEQPSADTIIGGALVLGSLVFNELFDLTRGKWLIS